MTVPDLLPVRMLNEVVYCPRLFHLEWVGREWAPNVYTADGDYQHRRVDQPGGALSDDDDVSATARSVEMSAPRVGFIAKMDVVESEGNKAVPVDVKRGRKPDLAEGAWLPERVQLCAQALVLRENGYDVEHGMLWFVATRQRVEVPITAELIDQTLAAARLARELAARPEPPPPLLDSPKCRGCSLSPICLPDEVNTLRTGAGLTTAERKPAPRVLVGDSDRRPLYVREYAARVGKKRDTLAVTFKGESLGEARIREVSQVVLMGDVSITAQAMRALCREAVPILHLSYGGWFYGMTQAAGHKNVERRLRQFALATDDAKALQVAQWLVEAKIRNSRVLLRRNSPDIEQGVLKEMKRLAKQASRATSLASLMGVEGMAARHYFQSFSGMLKGDLKTFDFERRSRRPACDPVNALLSYGYGLLTKDFTVTAAAVGFDPYLGFLHQPRYGRPALALDLMEPFRPLIVDSAVITAINNGELKPGHFIRRAGASALTKYGRKVFLTAYERRMDTEVTHPIFGYRLSYRRLLEMQTRLLDRFLMGEFDKYPAFVTR